MKAADGMVMKLASGVQLVVDGQPVELSKTMSYKGMMFSGIPNLAVAIGYTNASWTLKCELISRYVCRLLNHMDKHGYVRCTPRKADPTIKEEPIVNFTSGYIQRALPSLLHQGSKRPWKLNQNYLLDMLTFLPLAARLTDTSRIHSYFVSSHMVSDYITPGGAMVLLPQRDLIMVLTCDEETTAEGGMTWLLREVPRLRDAEYALNTDAGELSETRGGRHSRPSGNRPELFVSRRN